MGRPKVPRHALEAAKADVAGGVPQHEAAERHGIGARTLKRALAEDRAASSPMARPGATSKRGGGKAAEPADESLLDTLAAELRYARAARKKAQTDAAERSWSKRIEDLVRTLERLSPPPPVPPDQIAAEQRRLDGFVLGLIEQFLADAIKTSEVA